MEFDNDSASPKLLLEKKSSGFLRWTGYPAEQLLKWPIMATLATALLFTILYLEQHAEIGMLSLIFISLSLMYCCFVAFLVIMLIVNVLKRKYILVVMVCLALLTMFAAVARARKITEHTFYAIDLVRFNIFKDYYLSAISDDKDRAHRFAWGSGGFLGTNFFYTLLYLPDKSSEIPGISRGQGCSATAIELQKNFYIESEICQ